jgi:threonyl-tRNA synthetase
MLIFKRDAHSYKDLPLRIAETATLYRNERSGTLSGLTRVRALSQDDTHIFCREDQILSEIIILLEKIKGIYKVFDLKIDEIHLSTRPEKFLGKKETWDYAEENLKKALVEAGLKYQINEGDGAFYGPKIDVKVKDAIGRQWQLATIQLDYQLPQRFELYYDDADGSRKTPVVIHRAILGSMERFLGIIIEHYSGKFPLWFSPVQVIILSVADRHIEYAEKIAKEFKKNNLRVEIDSRAESIPKKVRDAQMQKINYILVVGDNEEKNMTVNVRTRDNVVHGEKNIDKFLFEVLGEIRERK